MHSGRMAAIRDFWLAYFAACGADLAKERYGGGGVGVGGGWVVDLFAES